MTTQSEKLSSFLQTCFNLSYLGLESQDWKQSTITEDITLCVYATPDASCRCAVGWLLELDSFWNEKEGTYIHGSWINVRNQLKLKPELQAAYDDFNEEEKDEVDEFLTTLQVVHDASKKDLPSMKQRFEDMAQEFNLTISTV